VIVIESLEGRKVVAADHSACNPFGAFPVSNLFIGVTICHAPAIFAISTDFV
jgi:hypothetical protein